MNEKPIVYGVCPRCKERLLPGDECLFLVTGMEEDGPSMQYPGGYSKPLLESIHVRCSTLQAHLTQTQFHALLAELHRRDKSRLP